MQKQNHSRNSKRHKIELHRSDREIEKERHREERLEKQMDTNRGQFITFVADSKESSCARVGAHHRDPVSEYTLSFSPRLIPFSKGSNH